MPPDKLNLGVYGGWPINDEGGLVDMVGRVVEWLPKESPKHAQGSNGCCAQYCVFVCSNMAFAGMFTPVLAKHSKSFSLKDGISVGMDRMQRNFEPMRKQVEAWQRSALTDVNGQSGHLRGLR